MGKSGVKAPSDLNSLFRLDAEKCCSPVWEMKETDVALEG